MTKTNWQCTEHIVIMVMVAYQPQQPCWIILKEIWVDENRALNTKIQDTNFGSWLYNTAIINPDGYNWSTAGQKASDELMTLFVSGNPHLRRQLSLLSKGETHNNKKTRTRVQPKTVLKGKNKIQGVSAQSKSYS